MKLKDLDKMASRESAIITAPAMTRAQHIRGCKQRALEYLDKGEIQNAVVSMLSDLGKNPKTARLAKSLELIGLCYVVNKDMAGARQFIEGFTE